MLLDGTEFEIPCKNGKYTSGEEMRELVARRIGLAPEYSSMFAVWILSGSLSMPQQAYSSLTPRSRNEASSLSFQCYEAMGGSFASIFNDWHIRCECLKMD
jgi:hypothetical protein